MGIGLNVDGGGGHGEKGGQVLEQMIGAHEI